MRRILLLFLALCVLALPGCAQHERFGHDPDIAYTPGSTVEPPLQPGKYGGQLATANLGDPKTFNFWVAQDENSGNVLGILYDVLETRDPYTLQFVPRLAYLPKISKDGLTYTFTLRPNLKWSDGQPLTADDIIFTLKVLYDPNVQTLMLQTLQIPVKQANGSFKLEPFKYEKIDDRTVRFTLPASFAPAMISFGFNIMPKHALEKLYDEGQFNSAWGIDTPANQIISSGPYVMTKYVPGQRVIYKANPYFWRYGADHQHLPYIDTYIYNITPDDNSMGLNFRAGGSDEVGVPLHLYPSFAQYARRDNYTVIDTGHDWGTGFVALNENATSTMSKTPALLKLFQNEQFRQALSYAIDRPTICKLISLGLAEPLYGPVTPANTVFYDSNTPQYPYNPQKAKAMLLALGCTPGPDGMLQYEGEPVKFTILHSTEGTTRYIAPIIVNDFRSIGVDAQSDMITFETLDSKIAAPPYDWQAVMMGFGGDAEPNDISDLWRTSSITHLWWPKEPHPEFPWEQKIEDDFSKGVTALTLADRKKYYNDWQEVAGEEQPLLFLDNPEDFTALRNHYGNVKPCSLGGVTWNQEEMFDTHATRLEP